jgi:hypothetical protein
MRYERPWQRLSEAVESVMAATRCSREEVQTALCQAIADQAVEIRCKLKRHTTRPITWTNVLEGRHFEIRPEIKPADLHWESSRPVNPWPVHREVFGFPGYWELEWIEVSRTDVTNVLCIPGESDEPTERASRSRPTRERAQQAINELYPQGMPSPTALPNAVLCRRVGEKLKELGVGDVSDDSILRAAGRRK